MLSALSVFYGTVFSGKLRAKPPPPETRGAWEVAAGGAAGGGRSGSAARQLEASPLLSFLKSAHRQEQASFLRDAEDGGQEIPSAAAADQDGGS
eukprot:SM007494S21879  [mRNA]  locus=s7494:103:718:+ [translate_table: standard]